jgi:RNA polymerase sigma-70 factor (sigma-E family)
MDARLSEYVQGQWPSLVRYATLLCGDAVEAEELVQSALVRVALRWPFVRDKDDPNGYVKRAIVHANINQWRRVRSRETLTADLPDVGVADGASAVADQDAVRRALAGLPPRQRAVLVLRYLDDMSEQETANVLGCSVGTVKSQAHKGLSKLRDTFAPQSTAADEVVR